MLPAGTFTGKVAFITGGGSGMGLAMALEFARTGATVAITSRDEGRRRRAVEAVEALGGRCIALSMDVRRPEEVEAAFAAVAAEAAPVDILVNNAAANPYFGPMLEQDLGSFEKTVEVNLRGYFWSCVQAARRMKARGAGGCIVNIASVNARRAAPGQGVYSMTKAGIVNLTEGLAKELARDGIRVNAVLPGLTDTKFASALTSNPKILGMMMQLTPLGRVAQPDEIAPAVLYLCSAASSYVTGSVLAVDGGYLA